MRRREPFDDQGNPLHACYWCGGEGIDEEARQCQACRGAGAVTFERIVALSGQDVYPSLFPGVEPLPFAGVVDARTGG